MIPFHVGPDLNHGERDRDSNTGEKDDRQTYLVAAVRVGHVQTCKRREKQSVWSGAGQFPLFPIPETYTRSCEASKYVTARQAMTEVSLELCARYGAWFRCAGDLRCGGSWRQLDPVGEFSKPMAPGPRSSILLRREFDG
jgi:hypothetical protein